MSGSVMENCIRRQKWLSGRSVERDGMLSASAGTSVNALPVFLYEGTRLVPKTPGTSFRLFGYRPEIPARYVYEYAYQEEANWTVFDRTLGTDGFSGEAAVIPQTAYWRIAVRPDAGGRTLAELFDLQEAAETKPPEPAWLDGEAKAVLKRVRDVRERDSAVFLLMSDTHYSVGCPFEDTVRSLSRVSEDIHPDGLIHLGDFTDGLLAGGFTRLLAEGIKEALSGIAPLYDVCIGNHDHNAFRGNPDRMSAEESARLYSVPARWYRRDLCEKHLTLFFLDSFDQTARCRYGFDRREVWWFRRELRRVPKGHAVMVFSHVPPEAKIHVWSDRIRNGPAMIRAAERFHRKRGGAVIAWVHGHNHAEQVFTEHAFPIVGIGCSKLESFSEHKPDGSVTAERRQGTPAQELFDVLVVYADKKKADFIRFGAGYDRHIPDSSSEGGKT